MKILDVEIDFDLFDADQVEKFEIEAKKVLEASKTTKIEDLSFSEALRAECQIVEDFFDNVFGRGISDKLFKGKKNLTEHIKAFEEIVSEKARKQTELEATLNKYLPNRDSRKKK